MNHLNSRRRVLAALAAMGVGTVAGMRGAGAQEAAPVGDTIVTVPCSVSYVEGTLENGKANYVAKAVTADFAFPAPMRAEGDEITLYSEAIGGAAKESLAAFRGSVVRRDDGSLVVSSLIIQWPFTAYETEGQFYNIISMAHEQDAAVGLALLSGITNIGEIQFVKGTFDPNNPVVGFDAGTSALVAEAMRGGPEFKVHLVVAGTVYSTITVASGSFQGFLDETLVPAMDEAKRLDAEAPCTDTLTAEDYEAYEDCFLTSACCTVIGLDDRCWELQTLRHFRDGWLSGFAAGRADVARYYREAPAVASRLVGSARGRRQLLGLYWRYIVPSAVLVRLGANRSAHRHYRRMMLDLLGPAAS